MVWIRYGAPGQIRTADLLVRSQTLYPTELRAQMILQYSNAQAATSRLRFVNWRVVAVSRVLFVCIGNSCRSQMAEGFARTYGPDVILAQSAGLAPASMIAPLTHRVMREKNIDLAKHYPKGMDPDVVRTCDILINMSGQKLMPFGPAHVEDWRVRDPMGEDEDVFREVSNEIEQRVMRLILNLRAQQTHPQQAGFDSGQSGPGQ